MKNIIEKFKKYLFGEIICIDPDEDEEETGLFSFFKKKNDIYEPNEVVHKLKEKKYISRQQAILLADKEKNLRKSMYIEAKRQGYNYGLIEIKDYYAILVKFKNKYAWYIKVLKGEYVKKDGTKYYKGYYNEDSNISCLILAETGEYIYLGTDFDTRSFRLTTNNEFLEFIHNVKK